MTHNLACYLPELQRQAGKRSSSCLSALASEDGQSNNSSGQATEETGPQNCPSARNGPIVFLTKALLFEYHLAQSPWAHANLTCSLLIKTWHLLIVICELPVRAGESHWACAQSSAPLVHRRRRVYVSLCTYVRVHRDRRARAASGGGGAEIVRAGRRMRALGAHWACAQRTFYTGNAM